MDDIVKQALARWPNVPHCYGWLALDARGAWRMRDEAAQQADSLGERLSHPALVGFINRNYAADERGCWYFQNGPQRVFVNLEAAPLIVRTDPAAGLVLHTGAPFGLPERAFLSAAGALFVCRDTLVAQVDDRDMAQLLQAIELDGRPITDEGLLAWLEGNSGRLVLRWLDGRIEIDRLAPDEAPQRFGFVRRPDRLG